MSDPFDEFEFKPITDGLGFHKKKTEFKMDSSLDSILKDNGLDLLDQDNKDLLRSPLPRNSFSLENKTIIEDVSTSKAVDEILKTLQNNKRLDFDKDKQNIKDSLKAPVKDQFLATTVSGQAIFLDSMLVIAGSLMCMISLLIVTRVDLIGNLTNTNSDWSIYAATASVFSLVTLVYMTVNRFVLGCTPGEWAFDQRIGKPEQMEQASYGFRIMARTMLNIFSGLIILPIMSTLLGRDIAGEISGTSLVKKV